MGDISRGDEISLIRGGDFEIGAEGVSAETSVQVVIEDVTPITLMPLTEDVNLVLGTGPATFTRATVATFVDKDDGLIKTSPSTGGNVQARFEKEGHLHEGESTNQILRSEEFDDAAWTKSATTVDDDATISPDGTMSADKIIPTATDANHQVSQPITPTANAVPTFCMFAKAGEFQWLRLRYDGAGADRCWFDVLNGVVGTDEFTIPSTITALINGWFLCEVHPGDIGAAPGTDNCQAFVNNADGETNFLGDGTSGLFMWGGQFEELPAATSYIKTLGSPVTRTAERLDIPVANIPNGPANFSVAITVAPLWIGTATSTNMIAWATTGETDNNRMLQVQSTDNFDWQIATTTVETNAASATTNLTKYVGTHDEGVASTIYLDGVAQTDTEAGSRGTTTITAISIGSQTTTETWYGHIKDFRVYDVALTASQVKGV